MREGILFLDSWWVWLFCIGCFCIYEQASVALEKQIAGMKHEIALSKKQLQEALCLQEELKLQLRSQSDPAWIELVLIQGLGVVPQGYKKIYIKHEKMAS